MHGNQSTAGCLGLFDPREETQQVVVIDAFEGDLRCVVDKGNRVVVFCFVAGPHLQWSSGSGSTSRSMPLSTIPTEVGMTPFLSSNAEHILCHKLSMSQLSSHL